MINQSLMERVPIPKAIQEKPELLPGLEIFLEAFNHLTTCRVSGMSLMPIPWTAIDQYCHSEGFFGEQRDRVIRYVTRLDESYLKDMSSK